VRVCAACMGALFVVGVMSARAQTAPPTPQRRITPSPSKPSRRVDFSAQVPWIGPASFGQSQEGLLRPDGSTLPVFTADSSLRSGVGVEVNLDIGLMRRLMAEVTGGWTRSTLASRVTGDAEGADALTVTDTLTRFSLEGAAVWTLRLRGRTTWFLRGGAGWMRELAGSSALVDDGVVGRVGAGVKYWWRDRPRGRLRRVGVRFDGGVQIRSGSITLGDHGLRVAPMVSGGLIFGF
jgi:hypothetical protein